MVQLILGLVFLTGLIGFIFKVTGEKSSKKLKEEELDQVLEESDILDIEEQIVKERNKQKGHKAKIDKMRNKND